LDQGSCGEASGDRVPRIGGRSRIRLSEDFSYTLFAEEHSALIGRVTHLVFPHYQAQLGFFREDRFSRREKELSHLGAAVVFFNGHQIFRTWAAGDLNIAELADGRDHVLTCFCMSKCIEIIAVFGFHYSPALASTICKIVLGFRDASHILTTPQCKSEPKQLCARRAIAQNG
jgi:hypothetical protein